MMWVQFVRCYVSGYICCAHTHSRLPIVIIFLSIFAFYRNVIIPEQPPNEQTYRSNAVLINAKAVATIINVTFEHVCGGNGNKERFHLMAMAMAIALAISV